MDVGVGTVALAYQAMGFPGAGTSGGSLTGAAFSRHGPFAVGSTRRQPSQPFFLVVLGWHGDMAAIAVGGHTTAVDG